MYGQLRSTDLSCMTKLILYKTLLLHVLLYGTEAWALLSTDTPALRVFERKVLRKIFDPVQVADDFFLRSNGELSKLLNNIAIVQLIKIQWLRWLGHVLRMEENAPARWVSVGRKKSRKPCHRMLWPADGGAQGVEVPGWMCCGFL